jgi:flagellar hook-length control protein FliK
MHTPTLPQISGAAPRANVNANANASGDGAQFSQALSREIEQRKPSPSPAAAPVKPQAAAAKAQQASPAQPAERQPAAAPVKSADGKGAAASGAAAATDEASNDAADAAAVSPVADMLALVAAFNQPAVVAAAPVTDPLVAAAAVAALKKAEPIEYSTQPIRLSPTAMSETLDGATLPAAPPAADGKALSFEEVAAAVGGAARMMDAPAPEPLKVDLALPRSAVGADATAVADKAPASLTTLAAVAAPAPPADGDAAPAMTKAEPALAPTMAKVDAAAPRAREGAADITAIKEPAAVAAAPVSAPVQQASLVMAHGVNANPGERIAARVGTPGWDNQVAQKIVWMVAGKEQSATLTLNPPDMGPMQVVLSVTNDQATVSFTAAQPEVRQALENAMPKLREMMSESGISLGNASVSEGAQDQRQAQQGDKSRGQGGGNRFGNGGDVAGPAEAPRAPRNGGTGLVDTFA